MLAVSKRSRLLLALIIFADVTLFGVSGLPASAQNEPKASLATLPPDSALDAMVEARNWTALGAALSRPPDAASMVRALNWLHVRVDGGAGLMVVLMYTRNLWIAGGALNVSDPSKDIRVTAGLMALYAYELIVIDGAKCEDRSAPSNRASQLLRFNSATFGFLKAQSVELKPKIVEIALALEKKTAPLRKDDDLICRNGMEEMKAGLERGTQREVPNTSGHFGKTVEVAPPPDSAPKLVPSATFVPMQESARATMQQNLLKLVE